VKSKTGPWQFLALVFLWTWSCWLIILARGGNPATYTLLFLLGGLAPSITGFWFSWRKRSSEERAEFKRTAFALQCIRPGLSLLVVLIFPAALMAGGFISYLLGEPFTGFAALKGYLTKPLLVQLIFLGSALLMGPIMEEFGWRGYLLDEITPPFGFWRGNLIIGGVWFVWHLPLFLMPGTWHSDWLTLTGSPAFLVWLTAASYLMAHTYYRCNRSIVSAIAIHFVMNLSVYLLAPDSVRAYWIASFLLLMAAIILVRNQLNSSNTLS
jgi:membrane protease YdiL (CAAX protease family)